MTSNARKHQFMKLFVSIIRNCLYQSLGLPNVSLQEAVLGLKMRSPITVILERGEGFFRRLQVESSCSHTWEKSRSKEERPAQAVFRQTHPEASRWTGRHLSASLVDIDV